MSGFLLDTNCISELIRARPEPRVVEWMESTDEALLHLSVLTLGEIRKGAASLADGRRRARIETWLETELQVRFWSRILPIDARVADRSGVLAAQAKRDGTSLPVIDGLLAATAMEHRLTLVTRNTRDVTAAGATVLDPWNPSP